MQLALLTARPEELGPTRGKDLWGIFWQNLLTFLRECLVHFCLAFEFLALLLAVLTFALSVTDISAESEKESSGSDAFLLVSEDCGNGTDRSLLRCL